MTERFVPAPPPGACRVRMTVAYDGTSFRGWARNEGVATVQETLEDTLGQILRHPIVLSCAGRTDAGVHARGQVVSFDADRERLDVHRLADSVNGLVGPAIAVRDVEVTADDFDARLSCVGRSYRYRVLNSVVPDPLTSRLVWHVRSPLDLDAMRLACDPLLGSHDFSSFCRRNKTRAGEELVRQVHQASWHRDGDVLRFDISANAFCHQMVRSIVGTLVEIGRGRRRAGDMGEILRARDRSAAPSPAPPGGLVLLRAHYR